MKEPECLDPNGNLVEFSKCPTSVLLAVAKGDVEWESTWGVPDEERIARQIAGAMANART